MWKWIAVIYMLFVLVAVVAGSTSNDGPLAFIFVIVAGIPWTPALSWLLGESAG